MPTYVQEHISQRIARSFPPSTVVVEKQKIGAVKARLCCVSQAVIYTHLFLPSITPLLNFSYVSSLSTADNWNFPLFPFQPIAVLDRSYVAEFLK